MARKPKTPISNQLRRSVFERDKYRCRYCGNDKGPFQADHVYPEGKGGETTLENLVTACANCNQRKRDEVGLWPKPIDYFRNRPSHIRETKLRRKNPTIWNTLSLYPVILSILPVLYILLQAFGQNTGLYSLNWFSTRDTIIVFALLVVLSFGMFIQTHFQRRP